MAPEVAEWFDMAEMDLKVAMHLINTFHPIPVEIICYHCQQCAEKATKAIIMSLVLQEDFRSCMIFLSC